MTSDFSEPPAYEDESVGDKEIDLEMSSVRTKIDVAAFDAIKEPLKIFISDIKDQKPLPSETSRIWAEIIHAAGWDAAKKIPEEIRIIKNRLLSL